MPQQPPAEYIRSGQIPFFRLPSHPGAPPPAARAVIAGVPFDLGSTHAPGSRFAPWEVRRVSAFVQGFHPVHRVDVFTALDAVDGGNVVFPPFNPGAMREAVEAHVAQVAAAGAVPALVGGDHAITLPALRALAKRHGPLAVVHVDAHLDTSGPELWGEPYHHGTPFRHAIDEGLVARGALFQVGIRGPWSSPAEAEPSARHGGRIYPVEEVADRGAAAVGGEIRRALGDRLFYLSFDVDALDPAHAPGTGTPVPGGLTSREALELLRALAGAAPCGMDVVEVCPARDTHDATSTVAAHLLYEGLALAAVSSRP